MTPVILFLGFLVPLASGQISVTTTDWLPDITLNSSRLHQTYTMNCGKDTTRLNSTFAIWDKVWRLNETQISFTSNPNYTILDNGGRLQINDLDYPDAGSYDCCVRQNTLTIAYNCYRTRFQIINTTVSNSTTNTTKPKPPVWNVDMTRASTLYAKIDETYYLKLWSDSVKNVTCFGSGGIPAPFLRTNYPHRDGFNDHVLIAYFQTNYTGTFACGASYNTSTSTSSTTFSPISGSGPTQVTFTITQSDTMTNPSAQTAPQGGIHEDSSHSSSIITLLIATMLTIIANQY